MIIENLVTNPSMEAAGSTVVVRTNVVRNPKAGANITDFSATADTGSPTFARVALAGGPVGVGDSWARATAAANATYMDIRNGGVGVNLVTASTYTLSGYIRPTAAAPVTGILYLQWFNSADTLLSTSSVDVGAIPGGWTRFSFTANRVPTATRVVAIFRMVGSVAIGDRLDVSGLLLEAGGALRSYFDGSTATDTDSTYAWASTADASTSAQRGVNVAGMGGDSGSVPIQSTSWAAAGTKSVRIIPTSSSSNSYAYSTISGLTIGATYTILGTVRVPVALTGMLDARALGLAVTGLVITYLPGFTPPANGAVTQEVRATFTATGTSHVIALFNGASEGGGDVWWDATAVIAGVFTGPYFDGDDASTDTITYTWTNTPHASMSREVAYLVGTNLTIGRFGIDIAVDSVSQWDEQGNRVTVSGQTHHGSIADALTLRQQLMGYVDSPDETFVPVTWAAQPSVNGFYRVLSARVDPHKDAAFGGVFLFSVDLERVQGYAAPLVECVSVGKLRTSGLALTARPFQGIPAGGRSFNEYHPDTRTLRPRAVDVRRAGESAVVNVFSRGTTATDDYVVGQVYLPPAKFYEGAATLLINSQVVTGRQIENAPADWLLSNDLFQVRPAAGVTASVEMRAWVSGGWSAWVKATLQSGYEEPSVGDPLPAPHTITVLSNSPEAVTIRLLTTVSFAPVTVDVTLRRGAHYVSAEMNANDYQFFTLKVPDFSAPTARTGGFSQVLTGGGTGVFGSAVGAGAKRFGTMFRQDEGVGFAPQYWNNFFSFCIGITPEAAQTLLNEYFWAGSEKQAVVAR